ncbi:Serine protein kinase /threonine protein kinase [Gordonia terrae C-6]|uniref:non-specific serine/threonine protein kinase n=1 Tax=Gordonia terrae C-6 TaxID=1316928 RepID=R7YD82_9ACTN|nr:serine/threonine-protein kinase [Gordonia terrae]EON34000.1 Serine protein kinase /threonine protein kinase [Gordonia terrae C-6]
MSASLRAGDRLGPYLIEGLIGRGGMGEVYRATDTRKDRVVALKLLGPQVADDPAFRDRFHRESRVAARLNDPHVIPIHDWGEIDGRLFIDMRLVDGRDLRTLLLQDGPLPAERALRIVGQIGDALDAAHRSGLVHRDVKPDNILVDDRDFAYLVDFGLAQADTDTRFTSTGTAVGSFGYMAPERFGDGVVGAPADIYALACVLFECLSGTNPFASATTIERLIAAHLTAPPPRLGAAVDEVIARGMAKDPGQRQHSSAELVADAGAALRSEPLGGAPTIIPGGPPPAVPVAPTVSTPGGPPGPGTPWDATRAAAWTAPPRRRSPLIPIVVATVVVLLICAGIVAWAIATTQQDQPAGTAGDAAPLSTTADATLPSTSASTAIGPSPGPASEPGPSSQPGPGPSTGVPRTIVPGDLGLTVPMTRPACDGTGIVVVANAIAPGNYPGEVQSYLNRYPGASYLRTDQSCPSLKQVSDVGTPIYAVYYVAGPTLDDICTLRNRIGGAAYGKWLDYTTDPASLITC